MHYSSGVYNKAFYLLAHTSGWNTQKASQAFAGANRNYWGPGTTFTQGACGVETAASDLGYPVADVTAAFTAVGVTCDAPTTTYSNSTVYSIPDRQSVGSTVTVSGRSGNGRSNSAVTVDISHQKIGDLRISLIAPDGSSYLLKAAKKTDGSTSLVTTYTVNLSSEALNGAWKLQVSDGVRKNTGTLNGWSIEF